MNKNILIWIIGILMFTSFVSAKDTITGKTIDCTDTKYDFCADYVTTNGTKALSGTCNVANGRLTLDVSCRDAATLDATKPFCIESTLSDTASGNYGQKLDDSSAGGGDLIYFVYRNVNIWFAGDTGWTVDSKVFAANTNISYIFCMNNSNNPKIQLRAYQNYTNYLNSTYNTWTPTTTEYVYYANSGYAYYNLRWNGTFSDAPYLSYTPPVILPSIVFLNQTPTSGYKSPISNMNFNSYWNLSNTTNCTLFINNTLNETINNYPAGNQTLVNFTKSMSNGPYSYLIQCADIAMKLNSTSISFEVVTPGTPGTFSVIKPNNSSVYINNITIQWTNATPIFGSNISYYSIYLMNGDKTYNKTIYPGYCSQEFANKSDSRDGNCGLQYNGTYALEGTWQFSSGLNTIDGSYGTLDACIGAACYAYANYSIPLKATSAKAFFKGGNSGGANFTLNITPTCYSAYPGKLVTRQFSLSGPAREGYECYNSTGWETLYLATLQSSIYEESIQWNIPMNFYNWTNDVSKSGYYYFNVTAFDSNGYNTSNISNATYIYQNIVLTPNQSAYSPINSSTYGILNFTTPNYQLNFSSVFNTHPDLTTTCSLILNYAVNSTKNYTGSTTQIIAFNISMDSVGGYYNYTINCTDAFNKANISGYDIFVDTVSPVATTNFTNGKIYKSPINITAQWNLSDNFLLSSYNISLNGIQYVGESSINSTSYQINFTANTSQSPIYAGINNVSLRIADGHTSLKLKDDWEVEQPIMDDWLQYNFKNTEGYIKIKGLPGTIFDKFATEKKVDRYTFDYIPSDKTKTKYEFDVESSEELFIIDAPQTYLKKWIVTKDRWIDFYTPDVPYDTIDITRISKNKIRVTLNNAVLNDGKIKFSSIGDLNIVYYNYSFTVYNITESYSEDIVGGFKTTYDLDIYGLNSSTLVALDINGTNQTATIISNTMPYKLEVNYTPDVAILLNNISHFWNINVSGGQTTTIKNQTIWPVQLGVCNGTLPYNILNISFYDEITNDPINATSNYLLNFTDGTYNYFNSGAFPSNTTDYVCTNLPPSKFIYNWNMHGTFQSASSGYVTRNFDIPSVVPLSISNNPSYSLNLYLIGIANSSTVTYTWLTSGFQAVSGTMRISKCNIDGTKSLVESVPIVNGQAVANIQLLTTSYSYEVVYNGLIFDDPISYSKCHVESSTAITYYIDYPTTTITNLLGLSSIACTMKKNGTSVIMSWGINPEDSSYVQGCIQAYRQNIYNMSLIYSNCTINSSDGYSMGVNVPSTGFTYTIKGLLKQGNNTAYCQEDAVEYVPDNSGADFGISGLFAAILLIISLALIYSGENDFMIGAAAVGVFLAWLIGVYVVNPLALSAIIIFLIAIAIIGRYTRKQ